MASIPDKKQTLEEIKVRGNQLVDRVREIIEQGNARRIIIRKDGQSVMELPLSVGVGGAAAAVVLSPTLAAIGAFASLVGDVSIAIERIDGAGGGTASSGGTSADSGTAAPFDPNAKPETTADTTATPGAASAPPATPGAPTVETGKTPVVEPTTSRGNQPPEQQ